MTSRPLLNKDQHEKLYLKLDPKHPRIPVRVDAGTQKNAAAPAQKNNYACNPSITCGLTCTPGGLSRVALHTHAVLVAVGADDRFRRLTQPTIADQFLLFSSRELSSSDAHQGVLDET